jgi:hypothetical protein
MNFYSATLDTFRRFAAPRRRPPILEKRTYVFILVPFHFGGNGRGRNAEIVQDLIDNSSDSNGARNDALSMLTGLDCSENRTPSKTTGVQDVNNAPGLNHDLMWTWFLPNPLWPPNKRKWNL